MKILISLLLALLFISSPAMALTYGQPIATTQSSVAEASHIFKTTPGYLTWFQVTTGASAGYVLFFDATTAPGNGTVTPKLCVSLAATTTTDRTFNDYPVPFVNGIVVEFSTSGCFTATSSATAFFAAQVQ